MFCRGGNIKIASRFCRGAGIFERYKRPATPCAPEVLALVHCPCPWCCGLPIGPVLGWCRAILAIFGCHVEQFSQSIGRAVEFSLPIKRQWLGIIGGPKGSAGRVLWLLLSLKKAPSASTVRRLLALVSLR